MCLSTVYSKKKRLELIEKHQKGKFITVRKFFLNPAPKQYSAVFYNTYRFYGGKNKTKGKYNDVGYKVAFHSFASKRDALDWESTYCWWTNVTDWKLKCCKVPVKSIIAGGEQNGSKVIISTEIICPKYFGNNPVRSRTSHK